jgi:mono/diheme cytochrome c family protein
MLRSTASALALLFALSGCGGAKDDKAGQDKAAKADDKKADDKKVDDKKVDDKKADDKAEPVAEPPAADPAMIDRGKYLAEVVMNCKACHTPLGPNGPDLERAYAGGLEYPDTFGTWRSPNITQDPKTGIGGWTDEQIITAVREGKRPTGEMMYPVMPYEYFSKASDEDMKALVAFLRTLEPIENAVEGNTTLTLAKPDHKPAEPMEPGLEPESQGQYLAALAHCGDCHTPIVDGKRDETKLFAGGREFTAFEFQGTGKVWSANITPDPETGIGKYSEDELMTAIVDLDKRDGSAIVGPMTFYTAAWSNLTHKDAKALAAYLRSLPPVVNAVPEATWQPPAVPAPAEGEPEPEPEPAAENND